MSALPWALVAGFAVLDWYAVWRGARRLEWFAKPLTMVALIGAAWTMGAPDTATGRWLLAALVLGLIGDIALLSESEPRFLAGLAAFLVGHLAFVGSLLSFRPTSGPAALLGALVVAMLVVFEGRRVLRASARHGGAGLAGAVAAYMFVIAAMVIAAWGTAQPLVAVGATVFMVSDAVLAHARFVGPWAPAPLVVITTYHLGQVLIVLGLLR